MDYFSLVGIIFTAPGMLVTLFLVNKIGLKVNNTVLKKSKSTIQLTSRSKVMYYSELRQWSQSGS